MVTGLSGFFSGFFISEFPFFAGLALCGCRCKDPAIRDQSETPESEDFLEDDELPLLGADFVRWALRFDFEPTEG